MKISLQVPRPHGRGVAWTVACVLAIVGCSRQPGDGAAAVEAAPTRTQAPAPIAGNGLSAPVSGDAQALGVLEVLDENGIALARQAMQRSPVGPMASFAQEMTQRHEQMLARTRALSPQSSEQSAALRARGQAAAASIDLEDGADAYRNAFMGTVAADYGDAVRIIDTELLPAARSEATRAHLQEARRLFAQGYEQARAAASSR